jgi:putative hydrolase of the HAD superfamily
VLPEHKTTSGPVEAVVFDMGGVLTVDPYQACRDYAAELGIPSATFVDQLRGPQFAEVETGDRSIRQYLTFACRDVDARLGVPVDIRRLANCLAAGQQVRPEMVALVGDLVRNGVKVGVLTNNVKEARSWWTSGVLPLESFAATVDSSEVGLRKPDPAIFALMAERMELRPGQLLYFDDIEENVVGAAAARLVAKMFLDPSTCRQVCGRYRLLAASWRRR